MSSYLQLCQAVARDSGTVSDLTSPSTVASQTGRLLRIVNWTTEAYEHIQLERDDWRWLRKEFEGSTLATVRRYALNTSSDRFKHWVFEGERGNETFSVYLPADGQSTEAYLQYEPWDDFRRIYLFGANADDTGKPRIITVDPASQLVFYPIPDAVYTIRGEYYRSPQILAANDDIPEMPLAHHEAIKWRALILLATFDEAFDQIPAWAAFLKKHRESLIRKDTPRITLAGPLA